MRTKSRFTGGDFQSKFDELISPEELENISQCYGPEKRRPPVLALRKLISGLTFHVLQDHGTFGANVKQLSAGGQAGRQQTLLAFDVLARPQFNRHGPG